MIQVKFFKTRASNDCEGIEKMVNDFLLEHAEDIDVIDIKYTATLPHSGNDAFRVWTVMIVYKNAN